MSSESGVMEPTATVGSPEEVNVLVAMRLGKTRRPPLQDFRVLDQPSFVLHARPYKETSLLVDVITKDYGRVSLVAKGAKRPHSQLRSVLQTFQPLHVSWSGKSELRTLIAADWIGGMLPLEGASLLCGFYLNELLVKFLMPGEPHTDLFNLYFSTLNQLAHAEPAAIALRQFEFSLLRESGLLGNICYCNQSQQTVDADSIYILDPESGIRPALLSDDFPRISGATLLAMQEGDYSSSITQQQSKALMRYLLSHHLHGGILNTRQILIDLQRL